MAMLVVALDFNLLL